MVCSVTSNDIYNNIFFNTEDVSELQCTKNKRFLFYGMLYGVDWYERFSVLEEPIAYNFGVVQKTPLIFNYAVNEGSYLLSIGIYTNPYCNTSQRTLIFNAAIRSS
jgi:hypothetical protein